jgi:hypothetical protein
VKTIATTKIDKVENNNNLRLWRSIEHAIMKRHVLLNRVLAVGLLAVIVLVPVGQAAQAQGKQDLLPPIVFQAAGLTAGSIQSTVDAFRAALGGHREIYWDGVGGVDTTTTTPVTPFNTFLNTRGAQFTTPGRPFPGRHRADPGRPCRAVQNPTYGTIFSTFSPSRLFTPVGSSVTEALFSYPAPMGAPATVTVRCGFHRR